MYLISIPIKNIKCCPAQGISSHLALFPAPPTSHDPPKKSRTTLCAVVIAFLTFHHDLLLVHKWHTLIVLPHLTIFNSRFYINQIKSQRFNGRATCPKLLGYRHPVDYPPHPTVGSRCHRRFRPFKSIANILHWSNISLGMPGLSNQFGGEKIECQFWWNAKVTGHFSIVRGGYRRLMACCVNIWAWLLISWFLHISLNFQVK